MASKSGQQEPEKAEVIEELLDTLDITLDRVKVLYEQYFLGIQKQPPAHLHGEAERRIRELAQLQIRNTALRYRFATLQQKFGAYHSYWRRTLRQIEHGTYTRSLLKIGRQAARTGAEVPEEILAAMPRRMREQVLRDREAALALARLRERQRSGREPPALGGEDAGDPGVEDLDPAAALREPTDVRAGALTTDGAHRIDESDADFDVDAFFASVTREDPRPPLEAPHEAAGPATPAPPGTAEIPRTARPARPGSRPPIASRTRTGHPRPGSSPGTPAATARASTDGGPSAAEAPQPRRSSSQMRAVTARAKTDPGAGAEAPQPRRSTGQMRAVTARTKTDPGASAEAAPPRRSSSQMRAVTARTKTDPGASAEVAPPRRSSSQMRAVTARAKTDPGAGAEPAQPRRSRPSPPPRIPAATGGERPSRSFPRAPSPVPPRPEPPQATPAPSQAAPAPSQATRPLRVAPGAAAARAPVAVETLAGPFPRTPGSPSMARPAAPSPSSADEPRQALPPGVSDADVKALYAKYVKAKRLLGEEPEPGTYGKLLRTITTQAPKIMQQYKSRSVDFSVAVKDNRVVIRAKPKP